MVRLLCAYALSVFVTLPLFSADATHVQIKQEGPSSFAVHLIDCDGNPVRDVPVGLVTIVSATDAEVRPISNAPPEWKRQTDARRFQQNDLYEFRGATPLWPEETTIAANVLQGDAVIASGKLTGVVPRSPVAWRLCLAFAGAFAATTIRIGLFKRRFDLSVFLHGIAGIAVAALIAWSASETTLLWKLFGFDERPQGSQSFVFLGLILGAFDPEKLLRRLSGQLDETVSPLTATELQNEITPLLAPEKFVRPFRDELVSVLLDDQYVAKHPEIAGRLETGLNTLKTKAKLPPELNQHLSPRLARIYTGAYRRNFEATMKATIDAAANHMVWHRKIYYEYVKNDVATPTGPEVVSNVCAAATEAAKKLSDTEVKTFGPVIRSVRIKIRNLNGGSPEIEYAGSQGTLLQLVSAAADCADATATIDVVFDRDMKTNEVSAKWELAFPAAFRVMPAVIVEIETQHVSRLKDGLSYLRVNQPTYGFNLHLEITPKVKYDIVEFEWKEEGKKSPTTTDQENGTAKLPGWLMPGNGVCIGWSGSKEVAASILKEEGARPSRWKAVLDSFARNQ